MRAPGKITSFPKGGTEGCFSLTGRGWGGGMGSISLRKLYSHLLKRCILHRTQQVHSHLRTQGTGRWIEKKRLHLSVHGSMFTLAKKCKQPQEPTPSWMSGQTKCGIYAQQKIKTEGLSTRAAARTRLERASCARSLSCVGLFVI